LGLLVAPFLLHLRNAVAAFWVAAAILLIVSVIAMRRQLQNRSQASAVSLLVGMAVLLLVLMVGVMPALERLKISPALAEAVNEATADEVPVVTFGYNEPTLNFYIGRPIQPLGSHEAIAEWARQPEPGILIITRVALIEIEGEYGPLGLQELASKEGLNPANGRTLAVAAMLRSGRAHE